jgi:hypothetical protein
MSWYLASDDIMLLLGQEDEFDYNICILQLISQEEKVDEMIT